MIPTQRRNSKEGVLQIVVGGFLVLLLTGLLLPPAPARAQSGQSPPAFDIADSWYLRSRTTGYSFRTAPPVGQPEEDHFEFYQHFDGAYSGMAHGKLDLRFSMRFADDWAMRANPTTPNRLHVLYLQYHTPWRGRARLGRLFLQEGVANYTMDGLYLSLKPTRRVRLRAWGGSHSPLDSRWEINSLGQEGTIGARALLMATRCLDLGLSWAYLERGGYTRYQKVGAEAKWAPVRGLNTILRGHYELATEQWDRAELRAWYQPTPSWPQLSLQVLDRRQSVDKNTWWERFLPSLDRIRLARAALRYETDARWGLELSYFGSFVDTFSQTRLDGALIFPYGRLGYSTRLGDAGEESRWFGDLRWKPVGWCDLQGGAMLATYALMKDAPSDEERDLVTLYLRALTRLRQGFDLHLELQSLENPLYSTDVRLLVGIDLALGGGASRTGLGTGGWLQ